MLPVVWSAKAERDLMGIVDYVGERNAQAAERFAHAMYAATAPLAKYPYLFKKSQRMEECRELVVRRNYVVLYRVEKECVRVTRVVHAMRVHL